MRDADLFHPTGSVPVYGFDAWSQLYTALDEVAPDTGSGWRSVPASTSDENASVRLGELIQAGTISLDTPRQTGGMLPSMPGAFPLQNAPDQRPTLTVSLYRPRVVTDGGDVTLDRLRISTQSSSTVSGADTTGGLSLPFVLSADDPDRNLLGATPPVLQRPVDASNFGSGVSGGRRDWLKTGSTSLPADGRGTRSYEVRADVHIQVAGPEGVRHVTGTATIRVEERDALGHGITEPNPMPQVYDLPALLTEGTGTAPEDWATIRPGAVRNNVNAGLDLTDDGFQLWVATGPDADGSRLTLALYAASRAARDNGRPVELVTRGPEGLRVWPFDPDGTLTGPQASDATTGVASLDQAWADFEREAAAFDQAEADHTAALDDEYEQRGLRPDAQDTLNDATTALTAAADKAHRTDTAATTAEQEADQAEQNLQNRITREKTLVGGISEARRTIGPLTDAVSEGERQELRLSAQINTARRRLADLTARAAEASAARGSGSGDTGGATTVESATPDEVVAPAPETVVGPPVGDDTTGPAPAVDPRLTQQITEVTAEIGKLDADLAEVRAGLERDGAALRDTQAGLDRDVAALNEARAQLPGAKATAGTRRSEAGKARGLAEDAALVHEDARENHERAAQTLGEIDTRIDNALGRRDDAAARRAAAETALPGATGPVLASAPRRCPRHARRWPRSARAGRVRAAPARRVPRPATHRSPATATSPRATTRPPGTRIRGTRTQGETTVRTRTPN